MKDKFDRRWNVWRSLKGSHDEGKLNIRNDDGDFICSIEPHNLLDGNKHIDHFDRIVACVNALNGIPNEALDDGVVGEMVEFVKKVNAYWEGNCQSDLEGEELYDGATAILAKLEGNDG